MTALDHKRVALVVARPRGDKPGDPEAVATGYFLTENLVLTVRHVADRPGCEFSVRAEVGESEEARWTEATPVWNGPGALDAMLLRTTKPFGSGKWMPPAFDAVERGSWETSGYAKIASDEASGDRNTFPLWGSFDVSRGQGPSQLTLTTEQIMAADWDQYLKGISGAPVFSTTDAGRSALIGIITDANRATPNGLTALLATRLLNNMQFRSIVYPSFLGTLPMRPFCVVLTAESSTPDLVGQVDGVLAGFRDEDVRLRDLHEVPIEIPIVDAIGSVENWAATVNALARADFLIADVTSFEPAIMLLLGIRSVLRRGVTVSVTSSEFVGHSSGATRECDPTKMGTPYPAIVPFNVQETRVLSYVDDNFYDDLHRAMTEGAANLAVDANYLDLPAYHAVRAPRPESWTHDDSNTVLVLCPFGTEYSDFYRRGLRAVIRAHSRNMTPLRMLDLRSPRLVGPALYEQIRWASRCLVDWTGWRPNVFFELGVRLACSEHDPLCIIDQNDLRETPGESPTALSGLKQYYLLRELIGPVAYDKSNPRRALKDKLKSWAAPSEIGTLTMGSYAGLPPSGTFAAAQESFRWNCDPMLIRPDLEQRDGAERILGKDPDRQPERLILFAGNQQFDAALRASVREKWISACLYLRHLHQSNEGAGDDSITNDFIFVSRLVEKALSSSRDGRHTMLGREIRELLELERAGALDGVATTVIEDFDDVLALKASAKIARDEGDWEKAISDLQDGIDHLVTLRTSDSPHLARKVASELADTYGMMGGIHRRWGLSFDGADRKRHLEQSIAAYDTGFRHEEDLDLKEASTYNRINRLIGRVLLNPGLLQNGNGGLDLIGELREAEEILAEQVATARQKDPWVYCDLGTVQLLRGDANAMSTFHALDRLRPPASVFVSALATLEPLAEVASEIRPDLFQALALIRRGAHQGIE